MQFLGKILVRRAKTTTGKPVLVIAGVVEADCPIELFDDRDEMWAVKLLVLDSKQFVNADNMHFSPEDFIENANDVQAKEKWTEVTPNITRRASNSNKGDRDGSYLHQPDSGRQPESESGA